MKIKLKPSFCKHCEFKISTYGYPCKLLMDLACGHYLESKKLTFSDVSYDDKIIKTPLSFLEKKGFLISTEVSENMVQIIPTTSKCLVFPDSWQFCWCDK
jgi:hypothetical protein